MTPEQEACEKIDDLLRQCGWDVHDYLHFNPSAAPGVTLRGVPIQGGCYDDLLIVNRTPVGVIKAMKLGTTLSSLSDQSGFYVHNLPNVFRSVGTFPFYYEFTSVETFFRDERDYFHRSCRAFAFHRPEAMTGSIAETSTLRARLAQMTFAHPPVKTRTRDCQVEAISNLEQSFTQAHPCALIQMATGTGTANLHLAPAIPTPSCKKRSQENANNPTTHRYGIRLLDTQTAAKRAAIN